MGAFKNQIFCIGFIIFLLLLPSGCSDESRSALKKDAQGVGEQVASTAEKAVVTATKVGTLAAGHFLVYQQDLRMALADLSTKKSLLIVGASLAKSPRLTCAVLVVGLLPVWDHEESRVVTYFTYAKREIQKMPEADQYDLTSVTFMLGMDPSVLWKLSIIRVGENEWISPNQAAIEWRDVLKESELHLQRAILAVKNEQFELAGKEVLLGLAPFYSASQRHIKEPAIAMINSLRFEIESGDIFGPVKDFIQLSQQAIAENGIPSVLQKEMVELKNGIMPEDTQN